MSGTIATGRSGYDADGNLMIYQPPNVVPAMQSQLGVTVSYGDWVTLLKGDDLPGPGTYEVQSGSGSLQGQQTVTYRSVTITGARS